MKTILATLIALGSITCLSAAVTIDPLVRTFTKSGGGASINTSGDESWTATTDVDWITIKPRTTGTPGVSCVYLVAANKSADTRVGHVFVSGNTHTVTQTGYEAVLSPQSLEVDRCEASYNVNIAVSAGVSWTAKEESPWLTITSVTNGVGSGMITFKTSENVSVMPRTGYIVIAGVTFSVVQNGIDVILDPETALISCDSTIYTVAVRAMDSVQWDVLITNDWVSVVEGDVGRGDGEVMLSVSANESFSYREARIVIGSAVLTLTQKGVDEVNVDIVPTEVTANPAGVYGSFDVTATPDGPWNVESYASWLTFPVGSGCGSGSFQYVASPNPTLSQRVGWLKVSPFVQTPNPDLGAGMLVCIRDGLRYSETGNGSVWLRKTYAEGDMADSSDYDRNFDGTFYLKLEGSRGDRFVTPIPYFARLTEFSFSATFTLGFLNRLNRLFMISDNLSIGVNVANRLYVNDLETDWKVTSTNTPFTLTLNKTADGNVSIWAAMTNDIPVMVIQSNISFRNPSCLEDFVVGRGVDPAMGNLTNGKLNSVRLWGRALTDEELRRVTAPLSAIVGVKKEIPGVKRLYFPLDGNGLFSTQEAGAAYPCRIRAYTDANKKWRENEQMDDFVLKTWQAATNRYNISQRAIRSDGTGSIKIDDLYCLLHTADSKTPFAYNAAMQDWHSVRFLSNLTMSFWLYLDGMPKDSDACLFRKGIKSNVSNWDPSQDPSRMALYATQDGKLKLCRMWESKSHAVTNVFSNVSLQEREWMHITVVGNTDNVTTFYVNGNEVGNFSGDRAFDNGWWGYAGFSSLVHVLTSEAHIAVDFMEIGGWKGGIDDLSFYLGELSSSQVSELYEAEKNNVKWYKVTQGIITPTLSETNVVVQTIGEARKVKLTVGPTVSWTATSTADWISVTSDSSGTGSSTVSYAVEPNPRAESRTGVVVIAGKKLEVFQPGLEVSVACDVKVMSTDSGFGEITVMTEGNALWSAVSEASWITMIDDGGQGAGSVMWVADPYDDSTQSRIGSVIVAGHRLYLTQRGYEMSVEPNAVSMDSTEETGEITVIVPLSAKWQAVSTVDWVSIVGAASGESSGTIRYTVAENNSGMTRMGSIIVAGEEFVITQTARVGLSVTTIGDGCVSGEGEYEKMAMAIVRATAADGYVFSHWSGDLSAETNEVAVLMDGTKHIQAHFIPRSAADRLLVSQYSGQGLYTRDQIHNLEVGNLVLDVDSTTGKARIGVQLQEASDLSNPNWQPVNVTTDDLDVGVDGTVGIKASATGNAKFFRVVTPNN